MGPEAQEEVVLVQLDDDGNPIPIGPTVEVEVVRNQEPEEPKNFWEEQGFIKEIARVCTDLEGEREQFLFSANTRQIIETISNARTVEDFDRYSDTQILEFIHTLRESVPRIEREMMAFVSQLTRARAVQVDTVDFI